MLVHAFAPMMPHLAEECWEALGHKSFVAAEPVAGRRPQPDRLGPGDLCRAGQRQEARRARDRTRTPTPKQIEKAALALDAVVRAMDNRPVRKVIVVPNRIVNVVV